MKNRIYVVLTISALILSGLVASPYVQKSIPQVQAQSSWNAYLTIDNAQGSSSGVPETIEISSWSWGATQTSTSSSGSGSGKVSMQDLHFTKRIDKSSPMLYSLASGKRVKSAVFTVSNGVDSFKINMSNATVKSYGLSGSGDQPTESVTLNFAKMTVTYDVKAAKK